LGNPVRSDGNLLEQLTLSDQREYVLEQVRAASDEQLQELWENDVAEQVRETQHGSTVEPLCARVGWVW